MKITRALMALTILALFAYPVIAHHAAQDILDEEIWLMIDEMVADTPHADIDFDSVGSGMIQLGINTNRVQSLEDMVEDGLLDYVQYLDGEVSLTIEFRDHNDYELIITQIPPTEEDADKSGGTIESVTLDQLKAGYR